MKRYIVFLLLVASSLVTAQTKLDMPTQLKQWSSTAPAHSGVIPIYDSPSGKYIPGDPFVTANIPAIVQKTSNSSSGSVASLVKAFASNLTAGNSVIVVCGVGNGTTPTITDGTNTYLLAKNVANGSAFNVNIFYANNVAAGATTVTINNGGTTASIAMEIYELSGLVTIGTNAIDLQNATNSATGTSTTISPGYVAPNYGNEWVFAAFGVGTAAQTVTVGGGFTNDSGQLNPTTPAGLFSFVSASQLSAVPSSITATGTITSEPWASVVVTFKPVTFQVSGTVQSTPEATAVLGAGCTPHHLLSAATTNGTVVKATGGQVYTLVITNTNAAQRFVKFSDATSITVGTTAVVQTFVVPGNTTGAGMVISFPTGMSFVNGITYGITGAIADNDTTAVAANEVVVNTCYK